MAANRMRRTVIAAAAAALLAACGSSTTESALVPGRLVAFGDALSDIGQNGPRYTVNDGSVNNWTLQIAARYGKPLTPVSAGGKSYATGNARVVARPDAAGNADTRTIAGQIDAFLASDQFADTDLVLMSGGISDLIVGMAAVNLGSQTEAAMLAAARQAGTDMAAQVQRLVAAGARHMLLSGSYDLGKSPWAKTMQREALLSQASSRFNEGLLLGIVDLGAHVLYVDLAYVVNLYTSAPSSFGFNNPTTPVCTSVDASNGIGIGPNQVNAALCNGTTLLSGANQNSYVFADMVHLSPSAQRQFGNTAYDRLRARW